MALYGRLANSKKEIDWSMAYQQDDRDPRAKGRGPCGLNHTPEKSYRSNQWGVWLNCEVCALRLHYAPTVGAPQTSLGLGPTPAHVQEMLSRLPINKSEINGNLVRGLLKIVQGEAQVRSSKTTKNQDKAAAASRGPSAQQGAGAKTVSTNEAAASSTARGGHKGASAATDRWEVLGEETTAATDRWEILVRRLYCCRTKRASYLVPGLE